MGWRRLLSAGIACFLTGCFACQALAIETSASSAVLMEQKSGRVLYEQAADEEMLIASITKIMTAVVALEHGDIGALYTVMSEDMAEGSSMYLRPGEVLSLEELLYGLMLASGNDAALAVAHCVSGELSEFVALMNETSRKLGMSHSSFANPNGLDQDGHYSSARDMAVLSAYALKNETFRRIVSTSSITIGDRYLQNHNKLLALCEGCIGVKTGYTKAAGRTLVSAAERQDMTLVCVTLKDGNDWNDHIDLINYGFSQYDMVILAGAGEMIFSAAVTGGTQQRVALAADRELSYPLKDGERLTLRVNSPVSIPAPVVPGQVVGTADLCLNGEVVFSVDLMAYEAVAMREDTEEPGRLARFFH